jgi:hypothetical protein
MTIEPIELGLLLKARFTASQRRSLPFETSVPKIPVPIGDLILGVRSRRRPNKSLKN